MYANKRFRDLIEMASARNQSVLDILDEAKKDGWFHCQKKDIMRKKCREIMCENHEMQSNCEAMR